jgi:hypothetical protein
MPAERPKGIVELYVSKPYKRKEKSFPPSHIGGKVPAHSNARSNELEGAPSFALFAKGGSYDKKARISSLPPSSLRIFAPSVSGFRFVPSPQNKNGAKSLRFYSVFSLRLP